jgi:hypothetical protein
MTLPKSERKEVIQKIQALVADGSTVPDACEKFNITPSTFYWWKKQTAEPGTALVPTRKRNAETPVHHVFPIGDSKGDGKVSVSIKGDPEDLGRFMRSIMGRNQ